MTLGKITSSGQSAIATAEVAYDVAMKEAVALHKLALEAAMRRKKLCNI